MTYPTKANAPGQGGAQAVQQSIKPVQFSPKSTATEAQRQRVIDAMRTGPKTSYELRRLGIYQAPARIKELRDRGYDIETQLVDLYDRDGYLHPRCALYHLISEPEAEQS